jgi:hypothetical protein
MKIREIIQKNKKRQENGCGAISCLSLHKVIVKNVTSSTHKGKDIAIIRMY